VRGNGVTTEPLPSAVWGVRRPVPLASQRALSASALLAGGSLLALTLASVLIVAIAAERPSTFTPTSAAGFFPAWIAGPLRGALPGLTSDGNRLAWLLSGLMIGMYVLYVLAFTNVDRLRARWTIGALVVIHVAFFLAPPMQYTDVFNYINYGRMGVLHHLNPYSSIPALGPHDDPSFRLSNWHHLLSPYGPVFTLLTYALVPLGVAATFWALKLVIALASLGTLALVWRCARLLGRSPNAAIALVGLNPIVLVWGLGADHNDALMVFFVVLAVYLYLRTPAAPRAAGAMLLVAVFIKASCALLLPVFFAAGYRRELIRGSLAAAVVLSAVSLIAFGPQAPDLSTQSGVVTAVGIPNLIGLALGQGGETTALQAAIEAVLLLVLAGCTIAVARRRMNWLTAAGVVLAGLAISLSWTVPWYLLWILPFAALSPARRLRVGVVVLGAYLLIAFMPAAYLLARDIHFAPQSTRLGVSHERQIQALLR